MASGKFFPAAGFDLGIAGTYATFNQSTLPRPGMLGQVIEDTGACYRLVQFDNGSGNVAAAVTHVAYWKTRASFIVTSDETDSEGLLHSPAGWFLLTVTDQNYCFVQCGGSLTVATDNSADIGDALILTVTDGVVAGQAAASVNTVPFGYFTTDDGSSNAAVAQLFLGMFL